MDDVEFSARAHANPHDNEQDFLDALANHGDRQQLLDEIRQLDDRLRTLSAAVNVPPQLRQRLLETSRPSWAQPWVQRGWLAIAASLVIAVGFVVSSLPYRPSAEELALHDAMVEHLYHEDARYRDAVPISWSEIEQVLASAGFNLQRSDATAAIPFIFANFCRLSSNQRAVHLVALGDHGPVSLLLIQSPPVGGNIAIQDSQFNGRILPVSSGNASGNMAVIGEKNENLGRYENLMASAVQWSL